MTMQMFKYCWHSKDFLSPLNDKSIIPQCRGNRMSLICQIQNQMWFKKRNSALRFFQLVTGEVLDVCPYAPHLQRKHLWESSPQLTEPALGLQPAATSPHAGSTEAAPTSGTALPTGMHTATQGGSASRPPPKLPEVSETLAAKTFMWSCVPAVAQTRWQEDYRLPWQLVRVEGCCRSCSSTDLTDQLNVSVGCFLLPQCPPSQLIKSLYFTSLLIPLYFWILPHPTTKPPCSISSVQRLPQTPSQQVDYGFSHQYLISNLSWPLHNIFCWYLNRACFSLPCACVHDVLQT